jgi:hypothetical protein
MQLKRSSNHTESRLLQLLHLFSPTGWLVVAVVSVVLASGSALLLTVRQDAAPSDAPGKAFDTVEQFIRDTIRLSFKDRLSNDTSHAVFVAPKGILDQDATLKWIENPRIIDSSDENAAPANIAPPRVLDPDWAPNFSGTPHDKKNP